jgi:hypothetical protein
MTDNQSKIDKKASGFSPSPTEIFAWTVILLLLFSVVGTILFHWNDGIKKTFLGFWIIVPPLWLWYEFCFLYESGKTPFSKDFEKFKYGQELSKNLWLSITAILVLLYFGKLPGF